MIGGTVRRRVAVGATTLALVGGLAGGVAVADSGGSTAARGAQRTAADPVAADGARVAEGRADALGRCRVTGTHPNRTAGYSSTSTQIVRQGAKGNVVKEIQCLLDYWGIFPHAIDGDFGPKTKAGVIEAQRRCNIAQDGVVGPDTWWCIR
ncbi:peptidoglycan-binding domain-containing protein [Streptomyces coeruleoprunus]|uniref:Peptidoglycan-binding domain-containing protein n=1 Tax=Streptomyces coeruleoprunus TaxID=285563 RepID=A0ABV9XGE1_9ACTN